jgi:choline dehydrogenase
MSVVHHEFTIGDGARSSARDYVRAALAKGGSKIEVRTGAACQRVLFDGSRATGVEYRDTRTGHVARVRTAGEVILCAGAIGSPHLLMLSGVGDRHQLDAHGISCITHLPGVGQNLEDHVGFFIDYAVQPSWLERQPGALTHGSGDLSVFLRVDSHGPRTRSDDGERPNVHVEFFTFNRYTPAEITFSSYMGTLPNRYFDATREKFGADRLPAMATFSFLVGLTKPRSRGAVTLAAADPAKRPAIATRYFDHDNDVRDAVAAVRYTRALARSMDSAGEELLPGSHVETDAELGEYIRTVGQSKHHPTGTCRMGALNLDPLAVVDGTLRVHGCRGLRVADCSILPEIVTANPQAVAMVIGEKLADMILCERARQ